MSSRAEHITGQQEEKEEQELLEHVEIDAHCEGAAKKNLKLARDAVNSRNFRAAIAAAREALAYLEALDKFNPPFGDTETEAKSRPKYRRLDIRPDRPSRRPESPLDVPTLRAMRQR